MLLNSQAWIIFWIQVTYMVLFSIFYILFKTFHKLVPLLLSDNTQEV